MIDTSVVSGTGLNPLPVLIALGVLAIVDVPAWAQVQLVATKVVGTRFAPVATLVLAGARNARIVSSRPGPPSGSPPPPSGPRHPRWARRQVPQVSTMLLTGTDRASQANSWNSNSTSHVTAMAIAGVTKVDMLS